MTGTRTNSGGLFGALVASVLLGMATGASAETTVHLLSDEPIDELVSMIKEFEAKNPGIKVVQETVPYDNYAAQISARMGSKDPSLEVYAVDAPQVPAYAAQGWLVNVDDLKAEIEGVANPRARPALSYQGHYWALPWLTSTQLLFYNKDLLAKAGIARLSAAEADRPTWEHILELAKKAQAAGAKWGVVLEQSDRYYQLQSLFESAGGGPGLAGEGLLTPAITTDKWISTANWYSDLFKGGLAPRGVATEQQNDLFRNGEVAFFVGGTWNFRRFNATKGLNYGVVANPYFAAGAPATPTDAWTIGISPFARNMDAARKLAIFMTLGEGTKFLGEGFHIPVSQASYDRYMEIAKETAAGPDAQKEMIAAKDVMAYDLKDAAVSRPRSTGFVVFEEVMRRAFDDIQNGAEVKATLADAEQQLKSALARK
jgi:multiple sugar transport system substrate-binding protein